MKKKYRQIERVDFVDGHNADNDFNRKMTMYEDEDGEGIDIHADYVAGDSHVVLSLGWEQVGEMLEFLGDAYNKNSGGRW